MTPLLTIKQVASHLQVDPRTVQQLIRDGKIHSHKFGHRTVRISVEDLIQYVKEGKT